MCDVGLYHATFFDVHMDASMWRLRAVIYTSGDILPQHHVNQAVVADTVARCKSSDIFMSWGIKTSRLDG